MLHPKFLSFFLFIISLPLLQSCGSDAMAQTEPESDFQVIETEILSLWFTGEPDDIPDWDATKIRVATNSSDLVQYWSDYSLDTPIPEVDFSDNTVVMYDRGPSGSAWVPVIPTIFAEASAEFLTTRVELQYVFCASEKDFVSPYHLHERALLIFTVPRGLDGNGHALFIGETVSINDC